MSASVLLLATLALLVGGCGGGSSDSADKPLTKAQFIKQADRICKRTDETVLGSLGQYEAAHSKSLAKASEREAAEAAILAVAIPLIVEEAEKIEGLSAPKGDERKIRAFAAGVAAAAKKAKANPYSLTGPQGGPLFAKVNKFATAYGFKQCDESI